MAKTQAPPPRSVTVVDRLRIECLVWMLDQRLYELPRQSRIGKRREVRANLLAAAADRGVGAALRGVGSSRALAREFLGAELGEGPRHSWLSAAWFAGLVPLGVNYVMSEAASAYEQGLSAARSGSGSFTWNGIGYLQSPLTFTVDQGQVTHTGGAWTPLVYVLWLAGTIACGRLWRLLPSPARRGGRPAAAGS